MSKYETSPLYADLDPLPLDPGGPNPLAAIAYSKDYETTMSYLRALMAKDEKSERALEVTEDLVEMNPAHYTVWLYRMEVVRDLSRRDSGAWRGRPVGVDEDEEDEGEGGVDEVDEAVEEAQKQGEEWENDDQGEHVSGDEENRTLFEQELDWLDDIAKRNQKNYQIWQHRQGIVLGIAGAATSSETDSDPEATVNDFTFASKNDAVRQLITREQSFIESMFKLDAKNYHVWSYRQWLVRTFGLWPSLSATADDIDQDDEELSFTTRMLNADVRNNSAWCHRWFILNGSPSAQKAGGFKHDDESRKRETEFVQTAIRRAPQNQSAWNYLSGLVREASILTSSGRNAEREREALKSFVEEFASLNGVDRIVSSFALEFLADLLAAGEDKEMAVEALRLLEEKFDPLRKRYWGYRKGLLEKGAGKGVAVAA